METVAGEQGLALQQLVPFNSFFNVIFKVRLS